VGFSKNRKSNIFFKSSTKRPKLYYSYIPYIKIVQLRIILGSFKKSFYLLGNARYRKSWSDYMQLSALYMAVFRGVRGETGPPTLDKNKINFWKYVWR